LYEPASSAWHRNDERGFRESTSSRKFFSPVEAQGANGRFQVRNRDGAMTEIGNCAIQILRGFDNYRYRSVDFFRLTSPSAAEGTRKKTVNSFSSLSSPATSALRDAMMALYT